MIANGRYHYEIYSDFSEEPARVEELPVGRLWWISRDLKRRGFTDERAAWMLGNALNNPRQWYEAVHERITARICYLPSGEKLP